LSEVILHDFESKNSEKTAVHLIFMSLVIRGIFWEGKLIIAPITSFIASVIKKNGKINCHHNDSKNRI
jgi:hypothetical protein